MIGTYRGSGQLLSGRTVEEVYSYVIIELIAQDKNHVLMIVKDDEEEFFEEPILLEVKNTKGGYSLTCSKIPALKMTIIKGLLNFSHSKVIIDEDTYTITFKAKK